MTTLPELCKLKLMKRKQPSSAGFTQIPNTIILNVLCKYTFPAYELRLLMFIMRQSIGWGVPGFYTSFREMSKATSIDVRNIGRTIKELEFKNIIATRKGSRTHVEFNMNYMTWRLKEPETLFTGVGKCDKVLSPETTEGVVSTDNTWPESDPEVLLLIKDFKERMKW